MLKTPILITGACGQIGSELVIALRKRYGFENVIETDVACEKRIKECENGPFRPVNVLDKALIEQTINDYEVKTIYHLAAILSAKGEKNPQLAYKINMEGLINILEVARKYKIDRVIVPSSIAVFGPTTPKENTPNSTLLDPTTMYGITKVAGEQLLTYYHKKFNLDTRSVRLPGIISYKQLPGGGTTDYAVEVFYGIIKTGRYTSFVTPETKLPMMYIDDCINALIQLGEVNAESLTTRVYNISSMSFSMKELVEEIKNQKKDIDVEYHPDFRQNIADSWPETINDTLARQDWSWKPEFTLKEMVSDMLIQIERKLSEEKY